MDTKWVKVFHVTNSDTVVADVSHHLVLKFLPTTQILINKDLGADRKCLDSEFLELSVIVGKTRSKTTQGKRSTDKNRVANLISGHNGFVNGAGAVRQGNGLVNFLKLGTKDLAILSRLNNWDLGSQHFDVCSLKLTGIPQLNTNIECGLTTHGDNDTVRLFLVDDFHHNVRTDRKEIHRVSTLCCIALFLRCLDRRNIGVD
mmetsp:Transcript_6664/g.12004  ORF Transcript_6664/g.12004 Transcript_6664/m.12004 type:complete len:202 (-) Transcript_6664:1422-2027(-)